MGFHYYFNASSSHRWPNCHGSKWLEKQVPSRPGGDAARTGTAAHYLGEMAVQFDQLTNVGSSLVGMYIRINKAGDAFDMVCHPGHKHGWPADFNCANPERVSDGIPYVIRIDEKMVEAVAQYTAIIAGIKAKYNGQAKVMIEETFELTPKMGGMSDCNIITPDGTLIVLDYKNGRGNVEAVDNSQLAMYGVGAAMKYGPKNFNKYVLGIVQPNVSGPALKTTVLTPEDIKRWAHYFVDAEKACLAAEAKLAINPNDESCFKTGSWCKWCDGSVKCPLMHKQTLAVAQRSLNDLAPANLPAVDQLDDARLMWLYDNAGSITEFLGNVKTHMQYLAISHGKVWPGLKVVESVTKMAFKEKDQLTNICKANYPNAFEPKLKAISKLKTIIPADLIEKHTHKPEGAPVLAAESDGRDSYKNKLLASIPALD